MPRRRSTAAAKKKRRPATKPTNGNAPVTPPAEVPAAAPPSAEVLDGTAHRDPILRRTVRLLPCRLTDTELLTLGGKLADALQDVATEQERQQSVKKELGARMAGLQARVSELSARLRRREEDREIGVEVVADFAAGVAREIRTDTGAVLLTRDLTPSERQPPLFDASVEPETASAQGATTTEPTAEPVRCIECGEVIETSAAETCPGGGDLCDGGKLHPGCVKPHEAEHVAVDDVEDLEDDEPGDEDEA